MARAVYNVVRRNSAWTVQVNGHSYGTFETEAAAVKIAIETASHAGRFNPEGAVVVGAAADQTQQVIWTYGKDVVPHDGFG